MREHEILDASPDEPIGFCWRCGETWLIVRQNGAVRCPRARGGQSHHITDPTYLSRARILRRLMDLTSQN